MTKTVRNSIIIGAVAVAAGALGIFLNSARGRRTTERLALQARELNRNIGAYADKYTKKGAEMAEKARKTVKNQANELMG
jgi:hypothetical protein